MGVIYDKEKDESGFVEDVVESFLLFHGHKGGLMYCPRCEQGLVVLALIRKTGEPICICDECDAVWVNSENIQKVNFIDYTEFMSERNLDPLWNELEILDNRRTSQSLGKRRE